MKSEFILNLKCNLIYNSIETETKGYFNWMIAYFPLIGQSETRRIGGITCSRCGEFSFSRCEIQSRIRCNCSRCEIQSRIRCNCSREN
jgi:hypothetical protein